MENHFSCIGFKEKLLMYLNLEKEIEISRTEIKDKATSLSNASNVYKWLEANSFSIDGRLKKYIDYMGTQLKEIDDNLKEKIDCLRILENELGGIGNFRHVVWSLTKEAGISLQQLATDLGCPEPTFEILCHDGQIDKESYIKLCNHFGLDIYDYRFSRYCPAINSELIIDEIKQFIEEV